MAQVKAPLVVLSVRVMFPRETNSPPFPGVAGPTQLPQDSTWPTHTTACSAKASASLASTQTTATDDVQASRAPDVTLALRPGGARVSRAVDHTLGARPQRAYGQALSVVRSSSYDTVAGTLDPRMISA